MIEVLRVIAAILALAALLGFALMMAGCGTTRDSETRTVERLQTSTGPMTVDTPIGQIHIQPVRHEMVRSQTEVSTEQTRIQAPEVGAIVGAVGSGTPWGAIAGLGGMLAAAFAGKKAMDFRRHRDQLIDGVESAREHLDEATDEKVKAALAAAQDRDLQTVIQRRTA